MPTNSQPAHCPTCLKRICECDRAEEEEREAPIYGSYRHVQEMNRQYGL